MNNRKIVPNSNQTIETVYENKYVTVRLVPSVWGPHVSIQSGSGKGAVVIIANKTATETNVLFVKQPRFALTKDNTEHNGYYTWELPRGGAMPNESIFDVAKREIEEETNIVLTNEKIIHMGSSFTDTGILNTEVDFFFVELENMDLEQINYNDKEISAHEWVSYENIKKAITDNSIKDNYTIVAFAKALLLGLIP